MKTPKASKRYKPPTQKQLKELLKAERKQALQEAIERLMANIRNGLYEALSLSV